MAQHAGYLEIAVVFEYEWTLFLSDFKQENKSTLYLAVFILILFFPRKLHPQESFRAEHDWTLFIKIYL